MSESSKGFSLFAPSAQAMESLPKCMVCDISALTWETLHSTGISAGSKDGRCSKTEKSKDTKTLCSSSDALRSKTKLCVKRLLLPVKPDIDQSKLQFPIPVWEDFPLHVQTESPCANTYCIRDKNHVCGICGRHLPSAEFSSTPAKPDQE